MYADEYGSLTSDADWAAKEMFKAALRERFPTRPREILTPVVDAVDSQSVRDLRIIFPQGDTSV